MDRGISVESALVRDSRYVAKAIRIGLALGGRVDRVDSQEVSTPKKLSNEKERCLTYLGTRVLLVGFGVLAREILRSLEQSEIAVVGVIDDGTPIVPDHLDFLGPISALPDVLEQGSCDAVIVAASLIPSKTIAWLAEQAHRFHVPITIAPERVEVSSLGSVHEITREPRIDDMFARSSLKVDYEQIDREVAGRRVLVTGAGGSIGSEVVRQLHESGAKQIGLLDRDDCLMHDLVVRLSGRMHDARLPLLHADIQHAGQLHRAFLQFKPDIVIHAAALKHVTTLEANPINALTINVGGTANVLEACETFAVDRLVNVSTDKAATRLSCLGMSKYIGERMVEGVGLPGYRSVRFSNVFGSRASVLHAFRLQARHHGQVIVRGDEPSRFFMTVGEAASLILSTLGQVGGCGTYVMDMGNPVAIHNLAEAVIEELGSLASIHHEALGDGEFESERLFATTEIPEATSIEGVFKVNTEPLDRQVVESMMQSLGDVYGLDDETVRQHLREIASS